MLLLAEGRQVALDALINGLWDDDPPPRRQGDRSHLYVQAAPSASAAPE
jgi:hypothetical protein